MVLKTHVLNFPVKPVFLRLFFNTLGCSFHCEDHGHFHIFIRSPKQDSFHTCTRQFISFPPSGILRTQNTPALRLAWLVQWKERCNRSSQTVRVQLPVKPVFFRSFFKGLGCSLYWEDHVHFHILTKTNIFSSTGIPSLQNAILV